ncbi:hypothetical protein BC943DRAFT_316385 [Umbelopsis sp. AD052]|nr:hypothetical protein BC943DRAFT_316385 [Umbelopsis sp. AD052]
MDQAKLADFQNDIHQKCVEKEYVSADDNRLSEYIITMLVNGKTQSDLDSELIQLIGNDYDPALSAWVFSELDRRSSAEKTDFDVEEVVMDEGDTNRQQSKPFQTRMFLQALRRAKSDQQDSFPETRRSSRRSASPQRRPNQAIDRSRSRSPNRERPVRRQDDRRGDRRNGNGRRADVFSRLGNNGRIGERSVMILDDKPSVFDRLGSHREVEEQKERKERVRCTFWPNCKKGDECPFWHPRTLCRDFPNCPKAANECLYVHPEIAKSEDAKPNCRYWPNCTNPRCPYPHPLGNAKANKRNPTPCRDGDNCTRPGCHFTHPRDNLSASSTLCRFGPNCQRYPDCPFEHPIPPTQHRNKQLVLNKPHVSERGFSVADDEVVERIPVGETANTTA